MLKQITLSLLRPKKNVILSFFCTIFLFNFSIGQDLSSLKKISNSYNQKEIAKQKEQIEKKYQASEKRVKIYLKNNPTQQRFYTLKGVQYYIKDIRKDGTPIIINTKNRESSDVIKTSSLYNGGSVGVNIQGQGMIAGVWDGGLVRTSHELLTGKTSQVDGATTLSDHATHVTGTFTGASIPAKPEARGIAFQATARTYFWDNDVAEYSDFGSAGNLVSNHSYGRGNTSEPIWSFGAYDADARTLDAVLALRPNYLQCWAGGNEQTSNNNVPNKQGYDVMTGTSASKNVLTVGAVDKDGNMSEFSNWGPTDDGRIKPDICAKGVSVTSSYSTSDNAYNTGDGTSYASPAVAGAALLLQQYHNSLFGSYMESAGVKGLLLHTATDLGAAGPDYKFGWGLLNAERAALVLKNSNNLISTPNSSTKFAKLTTNPNVGESVTYTVRAKGGEMLSSSICWVDDAGAEQLESEGVDPVSGRLIYDFDIKIIDLVTNQEYFPWKGAGMANRTQLSTRNSVNNIDNFEKVDIDAPIAGREYRIVITKATGSPVNVRNINLVVTGLESTVATSTTWNGTAWSNGLPTSSLDAVIESNTAPASFTCKNLEIKSGFTLDGNGITITLNGDLKNDGNGISGNGSLIIANNSALTGANSLNFSGNLTVSNGFTLTTNGKLILKSNATNTGSIGNSQGTISGNVTIERYIPGGTRRFRFLSHPFNTARPINILSGLSYTGAGGTGNGFTHTTATNNPSVFSFTTSNADGTGNDAGWTAISNATTANWGVGQGIRILVRGTLNEGFGTNTYTPSATTISMTGVINSGNVNVPLVLGGTGASANFNLVGNPYPSAVNVGAIINSNNDLNKTIYLRNPSTGSYHIKDLSLVANADYSIPANAAFFVVPTASTSLAFAETNKVATPSTDVVFNQPTNDPLPYLELQTLVNQDVYDNMYIKFDKNWSAKFDRKTDATKAQNDFVNVYAISEEGRKLAVDARSFIDKSIIPLGVTLNSGSRTLTIKASTFNIDNDLYEVTLFDKLTNTKTVLSKDASYSFVVNMNEANSYGDDRLQLLLSSKKAVQPINDVIAAGFKAKLQSTIIGGQIAVNLENAVGKTTIKVVNSSGQIVVSKDASNITSGTVNIAGSTLGKGVYFVQVQNGSTAVTLKATKP